MMKFKGFTLSEVLIAMLVLGIIVSASVPVILKLAPNKNVAMMKKAYYTTETIVNGLINDQYYYPDSSIHCQGGQASGATNATTGGVCYYGFDDRSAVNVPDVGNVNGQHKFSCLFASKLNIKDSLATFCTAAAANKEITTMDGMTWNFSAATGVDNLMIIVDVDGKDNGVHAFSLTGNKGLCGSNQIQSITQCQNGDLTARIKKNFDRIQLEVRRDGKIVIPNTQTDFIDVISGKKKVISGDDD